MAKIENFVICGCGAAGGNTFVHLVYCFPTANFSLVDFDTVEDRNIEAGTQPFSRTDLKRPKTQAMQRIAMTIKNKKVIVFNMKINMKKDIMDIVKTPENTLIIDALDNVEGRNIFIDLNKKYNVLHIGFNANLSGVSAWNEVYTKMEASPSDSKGDVCQMTLARPFIFALTSLAVMSISLFVEKGIKQNFFFDRNLNIRKF